MLNPRVQVHNLEGVLIAEFWDCLRLDPAPILDLRQRYDAHLRAKGRSELVIDLNGVAHAGSSSLSHFVTLQKHVRQQGGRMVFCQVDPDVRETFRISRLSPLFTFRDDRPSALAELAVSPRSSSPESPEPPSPLESSPPRDSTPKSPGGTLLRGRRRRKLS